MCETINKSALNFIGSIVDLKFVLPLPEIPVVNDNLTSEMQSNNIYSEGNIYSENDIISKFGCSSFDELISKYPNKLNDKSIKHCIASRMYMLFSNDLEDDSHRNKYLSYLNDQIKMIEVYEEYLKTEKEKEINEIKEYFEQQTKINEEKFQNSICIPINEEQKNI